MLKTFIRSNLPFNCLAIIAMLALTLGPLHYYAFMAKPWLSWSITNPSWQIMMGLVLAGDVALYIYYYSEISKSTQSLVLWLRYWTGNKHINRQRKTTLVYAVNHDR